MGLQLKYFLTNQTLKSFFKIFYYNYFYKNLLNLKNIVFLLFFPLIVISQNTFTISVTNSDNQPIARAIVVIEQDDNQVAFGTTDQNGVLEKNLPNGTFNIKISKLGLVASIKSVVINGATNLAVTLEIEANKLETVIIKMRPKMMHIKQDTISYNIKSIADGTERKVEDLIKKLPGLNVDVDGKVSFKGKPIDKVLIDGNEFFNDKHQMATQNIDAKMVDAIDLLTNYKGFSTSGGNGMVALNLKLKDGYRNKFVGDIEISSGINDAIRAHSNLFRFAKTGNLAIITDYNSIAKTPITIEDYRSMRVLIKDDDEQSSVESFDLPTFLEPINFIKEKRNGFIGINYTNTFGKKAKITFSNLLNNTNILQESFQKQINIGNNAPNILFSNSNKSAIFLNNSQFKWEYNKSKKTFFSYNFQFTPNVDNDNENIVKSNNNIKSNLSNNNISFQHAIKANTTLSGKINYRFKLSHSFINNQKQIALDGNLPFFDFGFTNINQDFNVFEQTIAIQNQLGFKKGNNVFSAKANINLNTNSSKSILSQTNEIDSNLQLNRKILYSEFTWMRYWTTKLSTTMVAKNTTTDIAFNQKSNIIARLEPSISVNYNLSATKKLSFNYNISHEFPSILQLQNNNIVENFQVIRTKSSVAFDQLIQKKEFGLDYLSINVYSQSIFFSKLSFANQDNAVANNIFYNVNFAQNNFILMPKNNQIRWLSLYDLKMKSIPFSLKTTTVFMSAKGFSAFDNILSNFKNETISAKQQLFSNFKKTVFQFEVGYNFNHQTVAQERNDFKNISYNYQIFGILKAKYKDKFKADVGYTKDFQNSGFQTNTIYFLNANVDYQISNKLKLIANGFNLLNLKNSQIIRISNSDNFFTESVNQIMPGYAMFGANYSF